MESTSFGSTAVLYYGYEQGNLTSVSRHDLFDPATPWQRYDLTTDDWGNVTKIEVQGASASDTVPTTWNTGITLASYSYTGNNGYLEKMTYGNGAYVTYTYDRFSRLTGETHFDSDGTKLYTITYLYDGNGNISVCRVHNGSGTLTDEYRYEYDSLGRLIRSWQTDGTNTVMNTEHIYDTQSRLTDQTWQIGNDSFAESYEYDTKDGSLTSMTTASGKVLTYGYDGLRRLETASNPVYTQTFGYWNLSTTRTTTQANSVTYAGLDDAASYTYTFNGNGRITKIVDATGAYYSYAYDGASKNLGQLRYATYYDAGGTALRGYTYSTDGSGNLTEVQIRDYEADTSEVNTYTYGNTSWADLLTAFDGYGIAYEGQTYNSTTNTVTGTAKSGNPISYYNGTRWTFGWSNGRQLTSASKTGTSISYTYDLNGIRTSKTVNGVKHTYYYAGGKLLRETYGSNVLDFAYTASGAPFSVTYNGTTYYYITNLQGDVMYLVNATGTRVAAYTYDPYGKVLTATGTMASINPLRYRGYYYDTETGFYYLQTRYYDPLVCRFINADGYASTGQGLLGYNTFAYCCNGPINYTDPTGLAAWGTNTVMDSGRQNKLNPAVVLAYVATTIESSLISYNGQEYVTYTAHILSEYFSPWAKNGKTQKLLVMEYSEILYQRIYDQAKQSGTGDYCLMSVNHIYSEEMAHLAVWNSFKIKSTEIADLNVTENRFHVLAIMNYYGYDQDQDYVIIHIRSGWEMNKYE